MIAYTPEETEEARQESLAEADEELLAQSARSPWAAYGAMHAAFLKTQEVEMALMDDVFILADADLYRLAHEAHTALFNLYQELGERLAALEKA